MLGGIYPDSLLFGDGSVPTALQGCQPAVNLLDRKNLQSIPTPICSENSLLRTFEAGLELRHAVPYIMNSPVEADFHASLGAPQAHERLLPLYIDAVLSLISES